MWPLSRQFCYLGSSQECDLTVVTGKNSKYHWTAFLFRVSNVVKLVLTEVNFFSMRMTRQIPMILILCVRTGHTACLFHTVLVALTCTWVAKLPADEISRCCYIVYVPEAHIMYFIPRCWFLNCSEQKGCMGGVGGGLRYVMLHYVPLPLPYPPLCAAMVWTQLWEVCDLISWPSGRGQMLCNYAPPLPASISGYLQ